MYLDSHAHLEASYYGDDLHRVIGNAWDANVRLIVAIGNGTPNNNHLDATISVADQYDFIYATVGVHPHEAELATSEFFRAIGEKAAHRKVIAWGEIGLDYHYNFSSPEVQKEVFQQQLVQAGKLGLPVVIHCRDAEQDLVELLKRNLRSHPWGVLHCFTGSSWLANRGLELGMYLSFSGVITFKNAAKLREIAGEIPADRLLVETDCPYLSPVPHRGRRNEPKYVRETTAVLASLRGVSVEELLAQMHQNFHNLFGAKVSLSIN